MTSYRKIHRMQADPDYRRQPKTSYFCINCQKDIDETKPHRFVHVIEGGDYFLHPEDESLYQFGCASDCGCHPIGNDCAKRLGLQWSVPSHGKGQTQ